MSLYLGNNLISGVLTPIQGARNIGQIIQSTIPLTDAGIHLLDGSLISGSGSYADFVTYIAGLVSTYPDLFETEANWQTSVSSFGVCDKFVYDSVNNTVRLPKRMSEHGYLLESDVNGTEWYRVWSDGWCEQGGTVGTGTTSGFPSYTIQLTKEYADTNFNVQVTGRYTSNTNDGTNYCSARTTGSITIISVGYGSDWQTSGYIDISDFKQSGLYEYIVLANSTKTDIEVDIDEIATDLNGKADVDLTNVNNSGTSRGAGWAMPSDRYVDLTLGASGTEYTAPANGWVYIAKSSGASNKYLTVGLKELSSSLIIEDYNVVSSYSQNLTILFPVKKNQVFLIGYNATGITNFFRFIYAVGSESEAS